MLRFNLGKAVLPMVLSLYTLSSWGAEAEALDTSIKGYAELGFIDSAGNSESTNLRAQLTLEKETEDWLHNAKFTALNSANRNNGKGIKRSTAEKYRGEVKSDWKVTDHGYLYLLSEYEEDRFSGLEYQARVGIGWGYRVIDRDTMTLALEIGPGYYYDKVKYQPADGDPTIRIGETFEWKFSNAAEFLQALNVETSTDNTITKFELAVRSNMTDTLALKVGTEFEYSKEVPAGKKHADRLTSAMITYRF